MIGLLGLLATALAAGLIAGACHTYGHSRFTRWVPVLLTLLYFVTQLFYPHISLQSLMAGVDYPLGDQVRILLLGLPLLIGASELIARLRAALKEANDLRYKLARKDKSWH